MYKRSKPRSTVADGMNSERRDREKALAERERCTAFRNFYKGKILGQRAAQIIVDDPLDPDRKEGDDNDRSKGAERI